MKPGEIESTSFDIIDREVGQHDFNESQWTIVRRMIHTTADFEFKDMVCFHPQAVAAGLEAIRGGKMIITDTNMARVGIRTQELARYGTSVKCYINDPGIREIAESNGTTRAKAAVDMAADDMQGGIYVVGNAPTALLRLIELVKDARVRPALIIGLPVGFVNAAESKAALMEMDYPYISNIGRKGGSNLAAAVVNALTILAGKGPAV
ncbi:precorrin-8X methylmutase [Alkalispirochaeta odontotermitis]|nr:precorrin-8X methylmutase [Alkalispirochaeta odontotermitis]CAB1077786.1 Cobalt-precorrin-8 methylmutase (EC [Olavius algarvensis Delta 1 endosymbiont]